MTFEEIEALSDDALNAAIERACYPDHGWVQCLEPALEGWWRLAHPDFPEPVLLPQPYMDYTSAWHRTMALCLRYGISLEYVRDSWTIRDSEGFYRLDARTDTDIRRCICALAVEAAQHEAGKEPRDA